MAADISRRELLTAAGAGAAALWLEQRGVEAQPAPGRPVVFSHTTVITVDAVQDDVALAVDGATIAAIGPTDAILQRYPNAEIYDGRFGIVGDHLPPVPAPPLPNVRLKARR